MKGSLLKGDVKSASASPLRALSGIPKCGTSGATDISYKWNVQFDILADGGGALHGHVRLFLQNVNNNTAPDCKPLGKWIAIMTLNLNQPIPQTDENGKATNPQAIFSITEHPTSSDTFGAPQAMVKALGKSWTPIIVDTPQGNGNASDFVQVNTWPVIAEGPGKPTLELIGFGAQAQFAGPDLFPMFNVDFSATGKQFQTFNLPEQTAFCGVNFYPFIGVNGTNILGQSAFIWSCLASSVGVFLPMDIGALQYSKTAFPNGTILGTLVMTFIRGPVTPLFTFSIIPLRTINFTNTSLYGPDFAPTWDWDFGDGSPHSTAVSPSHTYATTGKYHVILTATDVTGAVHVFDQYVNIILIADFSFIVDFGLIIQDAQFTDKSVGAVSWDWDFGDGSPHYLQQHPPDHNYPRHSVFTVTLKVADALGNFATKSLPLTTN